LSGPGGAALAGTAHGAGASPLTTHRGVLPPGSPARSMAPETPLLSACGAGDNGSMCNRLALTAIGQARRALERMSGMSFSEPAYQRLTLAQQLFVAVNLERTERGLAPATVLPRGQLQAVLGHRDILLTMSSLASCPGGRGELAVGTGHAGRAAGYGESDTVLMAGVCGPVPSDAVFTWARAKKLLGIR